jgi:hypothetical protein
MQSLDHITSLSNGAWLYVSGASPKCTPCSSFQISMPSEAFSKAPMVDLCNALFERHSITPYAISAIGAQWKTSGGRWSRSRSKLNDAIPNGLTHWFIAVYSDQWIDDWIYEKNLFRFSIEQQNGNINIQLSTTSNVDIITIEIIELFVIPEFKNKIAAFHVDLPFELSPTGYLEGGMILMFDRSFGKHSKPDRDEITNARDWRWKNSYWHDGMRDIYPFMILSEFQRNLPLADGQCLEQLIRDDSRMGQLTTLDGITSWQPTNFARDLLRRHYRPTWLGSSIIK